jgi:hypothetical protein
MNQLPSLSIPSIILSPSSPVPSEDPPPYWPPGPYRDDPTLDDFWALYGEAPPYELLDVETNRPLPASPKVRHYVSFADNLSDPSLVRNPRLRIARR